LLIISPLQYLECLEVFKHTAGESQAQAVVPGKRLLLLDERDVSAEGNIAL